MNYEDCLKYIYSFINVQNTETKTIENKTIENKTIENKTIENKTNKAIEDKTTLKERLASNLKRTQIILDEMGYKQTFKVIHIAGTKGKGSTTVVLSNILMASGYNVGRILSPHIIDFRERMTINNEWIEKDVVVDITLKIKATIERLSIKPSAFEIMTAMSLYYFYIRKIDYACVEVGLGGTYDSTNIVEPSVCIITSISYDHTDRLGNTLESIALEKSGIIKHGVPCVSAAQDSSVADVIKNACQNNSSNAYFYKKHFDADITENSINMLSFIYSEKSNIDNERNEHEQCYSLNIQSSLSCNYQAENLSLALYSYRILLGKKAENYIERILDVIKNIKFAGRFSIISQEPTIVVDGAHNAYSIACLLSNVTKYFDKKIILFFAPLKDKDIDGMCTAIKEYQSYLERIIITSSTFFAGLKEGDSSELYSKMNKHNFDVSIEKIENFEQALTLAKKYATESNLPLLITGSLYTVSSVIGMNNSLS